MIFLNNKGEVVNKTLKAIKEETGKPISWSLMHDINKHDCRTKEDKIKHDYLIKYLGKVSVFDWNNFKEWGYLHLFPHFQELAIKNGAKDKRTLKEV